MQLALLILLLLVYLYFGWPERVKDAIRRGPGGGETQGGIFAIVVLLSFIFIYVTLVFLGGAEDRPWQATGTVFNAMFITAGIFFTAIRLFPPTFYAAFSKVINSKTGEYERDRVDEITLKKGQWSPIYLPIHNTSTFTWDNYRITIGLPDGFEASEQVDEFPGSDKWNFAPLPNSLIIGQGYIQKKTTTVLTIGETLANRFFLRANKSGNFKLDIRMTSAGRIGERRQLLKICVT